ncbi:GNAT family acetyltransferase [Trichococcus patagoniensis]|uniref:GNAT family acetyltransferase n=1 Tax=Trichococcus patagoniensis TaxID=382641 RepID=A0A2T5IJD1_9LACT|nr:GNAT family N-acetyltransferase [Trichococcus patagoniensis]PTQ83928.1 GNAT family acetyltransferase [Trichococcus patagoniensis]
MITIRDGAPADEFFLKEMTYQAIYSPKGGGFLPRKILEEPAIRRYYADFGREGDLAFVALSDGEAVGAVWIRFATAESKGYGFVREDVPELTLAVLPAFRGCGIGTALLEQMLTWLQATGVVAVSLSVSRSNPVRKLYERKGFRIVKKQRNSCTMLVELTCLYKGTFS